jgi:hypothetical protein
MKTDITPTARKIMVDIAGTISVPALSGVSHTEAHEVFTQKVVAGTLRKMCVPQIKAERLAAIHEGCPRVRMAKIMRMEGLK